MGGFDAYVRPFVPVGLRHKGKAAKKAIKPDVRDLAMVTIHSLLEAHAQCLESSAVSDVLSYCPWVPDILRDLATAAAGTLSGSESAECVDRLEHAAAAYIPTIFTGTNQDWILRYYGLTKLESVLKLAKEDSSVPAHFEGNWVEGCGALPTPSTLLSKPTAKKKKTEAPKPWCGYAGVYPKNLDTNKALYEKIALHFRGYGVPGKTKQSQGARGTAPSVIGNIITNWFSLAEQAIDNEPIRSATGKKAKGRAPASQRPSKRRRKETTVEPPVEVEATKAESGEQSMPDANW